MACTNYLVPQYLQAALASQMARMPESGESSRVGGNSAQYSERNFRRKHVVALARIDSSFRWPDADSARRQCVAALAAIKIERFTHPDGLAIEDDALLCNDGYPGGGNGLALGNRFAIDPGGALSTAAFDQTADRNGSAKNFISPFPALYFSLCCSLCLMSSSSHNRGALRR